MDNKTKAIEACLSNDEISTDGELIDYFMSEIKITKKQAEYWVSKRDYYLNNLMGG